MLKIVEESVEPEFAKAERYHRTEESSTGVKPIPHHATSSNTTQPSEDDRVERQHESMKSNSFHGRLLEELVDRRLHLHN